MAEFTKTYTFNCPYCGNDKIVKNGTQFGKQRYRCKACRKQFNDTGAVGGRHATAEQIGMAIRMYYGGNSYKQTAETMADGHDISEPSKETLYRWVTEYTDAAKDLLADHPAHTSGKWVADEIQVRVGGEKMWLWNVMDANTRYALAVHLSPNRDNRAAVAVMRKAMAAADAPPRSITTDKLGSYTGAIKTVFPDAEHIQSEGIRARVNNNLSERLQGTIRDREKTLRGLDGLASGQAYFDGWLINYNLFREHEGIDHQTPAEMAGVNPPFTEWADVVRVAATDTDTKRKPAAPDMAEVADRAERRGEATAPPTTHFVPDTTRRVRPKGETDTDDPDEEWPPTPATVARWRAGDDVPVPSRERIVTERADIGRVFAGKPLGVRGRVKSHPPKGRIGKPKKRARTSKHDSLQKALSKRGRARRR